MEEHNLQSDREEDPGKKFLWIIGLAPGISRFHATVFCYASFATIGLLTFVSTGTTLVLNANLGIATGDQGTIMGDLVIATEIGQFLVFGLVGILADRIGRREVFAIGMFVMGISYALYPFAESIAELTVYRVIYAVGLGAATGMLQTILADYPLDRSRGKLVAVGGLFNGIGVIVVTVLFGALAPPALIEAGYDAVTTSRITHGVVAAACFISSVVFLVGLKKGTPGSKKERPPIKELVVSGLTEARNPRIALSYAAAFVARGDLVILGTFTVLWGSVVGIERGMDPAIAAARGAQIFGLASLGALLWLVVLFFFMDRFNRVSGAVFCMALASIGYSSMWFVEDPLSTAAIPLFLILGVGQISAFFGATVLISHEAPKLKRGAVIGMFNMCGAVGIFVSSGVGGRLFDSIGPAAPFVLVGAMNFCVFLLAVVVRIYSPGSMPIPRAARALEQTD
jgi:MFS family permease